MAVTENDFYEYIAFDRDGNPRDKTESIFALCKVFDNYYSITKSGEGGGERLRLKNAREGSKTISNINTISIKFGKLLLKCSLKDMEEFYNKYFLKSVNNKILSVQGEPQKRGKQRNKQKFDALIKRAQNKGNQYFMTARNTVIKEREKKITEKYNHNTKRANKVIEEYNRNIESYNTGRDFIKLLRSFEKIDNVSDFTKKIHSVGVTLDKFKINTQSIYDKYPKTLKKFENTIIDFFKTAAKTEVNKIDELKNSIENCSLLKSNPEFNNTIKQICKELGKPYHETLKKEIPELKTLSKSIFNGDSEMWNESVKNYDKKYKEIHNTITKLKYNNNFFNDLSDIDTSTLIQEKIEETTSDIFMNYNNTDTPTDAQKKLKTLIKIGVERGFFGKENFEEDIKFLLTNQQKEELEEELEKINQPKTEKHKPISLQNTKNSNSNEKNNTEQQNESVVEFQPYNRQESGSSLDHYIKQRHGKLNKATLINYLRDNGSKENFIAVMKKAKENEIKFDKKDISREFRSYFDGNILNEKNFDDEFKGKHGVTYADVVDE